MSHVSKSENKMESNAENILVNGTNVRGATMFEWTQADGQYIQVPGFVSPQGSVSIFLPPEFMDVNVEKQDELLNIPMGGDMQDVEFEFDSPPVAILEDNTLLAIEHFQRMDDEESQSGLIYQNQVIEEVEDDEMLTNYSKTLKLDSVDEEKDEQDKTVPVKKSGRPKKNPLPPNGLGPFRCERCDDEFKNYVDYLTHKKIHFAQKKIPCIHCNESFNKEKNLKLHEALRHTHNLICPECQKCFARFAAFKAHLAFHEEDDTIPCPVCGEEFELNLMLEQHILKLHKPKEQAKSFNPTFRVTSTLSRFSCSTCSRPFTNYLSLKNHRKEHDRFKVEFDVFGRPKRKKRAAKKIGRLLPCTQCEKKFDRPSQLQRHMRVHTGEKPFVCHVCDTAFNQKGTLTVHMAKHNGSKPFECPYCGNKFTQRGNLISHVSKAHQFIERGKDRFDCPDCPCSFAKQQALHCHITRFHEIRKKEAQEQQAKEQQNEEMIQEADTVVDMDILQKALRESGLRAEEIPSFDIGLVDQQPPSSPLPEEEAEQEAEDEEQEQEVVETPVLNLKEVKSDGSAVWHTVAVHYDGTGRWYGCHTCKKHFKKPSDLLRHIRTHTQEKPYRCNVCYRAFAMKPTLISHQRTHTVRPTYDCHVCSKQLSCKSALQRHLETHETSGNFPCSPCELAFRSASQLKEHQTTQKHKATSQASLPPPYVRMEKNGGFKIEISRKERFLENSQSASFEERPHKCEICLVRFRKSSHLKQHLMIHTGARPFKCNVCEKSFCKYGVLKTHIKTHLGLKPFTCKVCQATFSMRGSLNRHCQTLHSDERPYLCPVCERTFKTSQQCKKHMHRTHIKNTEKVSYSKEPEEKTNEEVEEDEQEMVEALPSAVDIGAEDVNQSFFADETGTITLPPLSKESIQELEQTLNQQFFSTVVTTVDPIANEVYLESPKELLLGVNMEVGDSVTDEDYGAADGLTTVTDMFQILPDGTGNLCGYPVLADVESRQVTPVEGPEKKMADVGSERKTVRVLTCDQCGWKTQSERALMRHLTEHYQNVRPRIKRTKAPVKEFTAEETAELATKYLSACASESEKILVAAAAEKIGRVSDRRGKKKKRPSVRCEKCDRGFTRNSDLIRHERTHTGERPYQCELCERRFTVKSTLVCHMKTHSTRPILTCHVCGAEFSARSSLKVHMRLHTGARPFPCPLCLERFRTSGHLKNHIESHTSNKPIRPWTSDAIHHIANYFSSGLPKLQDEITPIDEKENLESSEGEVRLPNLSDALVLPDDSVAQLLSDQSPFNEQFVEVFSEPEPPVIAKKPRRKNGPPVSYSCSTCGRSFSKQSLLVRHVRVHTGDRPFECQYCGKRFNQKHVLGEHIKAYHEGVRPNKQYSCPYCSFKSVQKGNLKVHIGRLHQFAYYLEKCKEKGTSRTSGIKSKDDALEETVVAGIVESLDSGEDRNLGLSMTEDRNTDLEQVMGELFPQVT